jgi:hypothetical protein
MHLLETNPNSYRLAVVPRISISCVRKNWKGSLIVPRCPKKFKEAGDHFCVMLQEIQVMAARDEHPLIPNPAAVNASAIVSDWLTWMSGSRNPCTSSIGRSPGER